jgi:hypothetical protein
MTSSRSSSSRRLAAALVAAVATVGVAAPQQPARRPAGPAITGARPKAPPPRPPPAPRPGKSARVAFFPPVNLSGVSVPSAEIAAAAEVALRARGIEIVGGGVLDWFLARQRVRYTGGIDAATATAAREELGVDAALFASVDLYARLGVPRYGMTMRLVSASDPPTVLWMDAVAFTGDESPGLFDLGVVKDVRVLQRRAHERLARSLAAYLDGRHEPAGECAGGGRFEPRVFFRAPRPAYGDRTLIAILPFVNESPRRDAGELASQAMLRQLAGEKGLEVLEPGVVRAALLQNHVVMEGGVTHEAARIALAALDADVVLGGYVRTYEEAGTPSVELTLVALSTFDNHVVWESSSWSKGSAPFEFFGLGREPTANAVLCRMSRAAADRMASAWAPEPRPDRVPAPRTDRLSAERPPAPAAK